MPTLYLFDNFDEPKGTLPLCSAMVHSEQVKGDDRISFKTSVEPDKCDRILWRDEDDGCWREFVVRSVVRDLGGAFEVVAESSLFELRCDYVENTVLKSATAREAVTAAIASTRWALDASCQSLGAVTVWFYHESALDALREVEDKLNCELYARITVADGRVSGRYIGVADGEDTSVIANPAQKIVFEQLRMAFKEIIDSRETILAEIDATFAVAEAKYLNQEVSADV